MSGTTGAVAVPLCTSGGLVDLSNLTMTAYVRLSASGIGSLSFLFFDAWTSAGASTSPVAFGDNLNSTAGTWQKWSYKFPSDTQANHVAIRFNPSPAWTGTIFIDNVQIGP
jgi:hypothetical protein